MPQPCSTHPRRPAEQPASVPEIAGNPLSGLHGGRWPRQPGGLRLEDRLVMQLVYQHGGQTLEVYLNAEGKEVDGQPITQDRQMKFVPLPSPPDRLEADWERLLAAGNRLAEERLPAGAMLDLVACRAIWCKYVEGKLRFTIAAASIDLPFSGWTRTLCAAALCLPSHGCGNLPACRHRRRADRRGRADRGLCRDRPPAAEHGVGALRGDRPPREPGTGRGLPDQRPAVAAERDGPVRLLSAASQPASRGTEPVSGLPAVESGREGRSAHGPAPARTSRAGPLAAVADERDVPGLCVGRHRLAEAAAGGRGQGNPRTSPHGHGRPAFVPLGRGRAGPIRLRAARVGTVG